MQSDLLLGDQMYHLTLSKVEIPHSENAEVEYYTTYPKTPKKGRETPPKVRLRMRTPFRSLPVAPPQMRLELYPNTTQMRSIMQIKNENYSNRINISLSKCKVHVVLNYHDKKHVYHDDTY